jgi:FkbM family methyltransferase
MLAISRLRRFIETAPQQAALIGWYRVIQDRIFRRLGIEEFYIQPRGAHPAVCRVATADIYEYMHALGQGPRKFGLPFTPQTIIDAGAHVGYTALWLRQQFPDAVIIAIEPEPRNIVQFKKNCLPSDSISLEEAALWPTKGRLRISNQSCNTNNFQCEDDENGDISTITVSDIMQKYHIPQIDLLKIDIEGGEIPLFSRSTEWLTNVRSILIETHDGFIPDCTAIVERALGTTFLFCGHVGEYKLYLRSIDSSTSSLKASPH